MLETKNTKLIDVYEWDTLVSNTYGKIYSLQQQKGCQSKGTIVKLTVPDKNWEEQEMNDKIPEVINGSKMGVKFHVWLNRDRDEPLNPSKEELKKCYYYKGKTEEDEIKWNNDKSNIILFWERNFYPCVQSVANDLYKKKLIKSGDYLIEIDW